MLRRLNLMMTLQELSSIANAACLPSDSSICICSGVLQSPPPLANTKSIPQSIALRNEADRRKTQEVHEQEYQQALITIKEKIRETEGPDIKETLMDQIRQWFIECR